MPHRRARRVTDVLEVALPRLPQGTARQTSRWRLFGLSRGGTASRREGGESKMKRVALLGMLLPAMLAAQGVRISGVTTMQLVELRPLIIDSLPASAVAGTGQFRTAAFGVPSVCDTL